MLCRNKAVASPPSQQAEQRPEMQVRSMGCIFRRQRQPEAGRQAGRRVTQIHACMRARRMCQVVQMQYVAVQEYSALHSTFCDRHRLTHIVLRGHKDLTKSSGTGTKRWSGKVRYEKTSDLCGILGKFHHSGKKLHFLKN